MASHKHQRCCPPVHWLTGRFVCCQRVTPHTHPGPCSCCLSCHPVHPVVHLVWTVLQHFIHKGRHDPLATTSAAWFPMRDPSQAPVRDRRRSQSTFTYITLQPMTAYISKSAALPPPPPPPARHNFLHFVTKYRREPPTHLQTCSVQGPHFCVQL